MDTHSNSDDLDLLAAELVEEIDRLLALPTQNAPTQPARISNAMWGLLTTVPNRTYVPPYPPRVNPPIEHFFMHDAQPNVQFNEAVAALVAGLRALAQPSGPNVPNTGDDFEEVD